MTIRNKTLRIAVRKFPPFERAMEKLWERYCAHSGCTLRAEMVPMDLHLLYQSLIADKGLLNGDWDVAHMNTDWLYEAGTGGALEDLSPYIRKAPPEDFPGGWSRSLLAMQELGGGIMGLPFHDGPESLVYRKDLFNDPREQAAFRQQHGKPLRPPETWEEFQAVARFFHRPAENLYGAVFAAYPDGHNTVFDFCLQLWTRGGALTDAAGYVQIDSTAALEGLTFYRQLLKDEAAVHPQSAQYESVQAGMAFARGEAAMMINWFGFAAICEVDAASQVKGKVDITDIPRGSNGGHASLNVYWLYTVAAGSPHKDIAYDLLRYAVSRQNDKQLTLEGGIGCRISTWKDEEINHIVPYYHKLEQLHRHARCLPQKSSWAEIAAVIDDVVQQAIQADRPVKALLEEGQERIRRIDHKKA